MTISSVFSISHFNSGSDWESPDARFLAEFSLGKGINNVILSQLSLGFLINKICRGPVQQF